MLQATSAARAMRAASAAILTAVAGCAPALATDWKTETTSSSSSMSHCQDASGNPGCWATYISTTVRYSGYFAGQAEAAAACRSVLDDQACGYASGEPGPPLMSGGWLVTCPGGRNQYGFCVSSLSRYAVAYFPTLVVEQDIERPDDCRASSHRFGNPIDGLTGEKHEQITLLRWSPHAPPLTLHYRSGRFARQVGSSAVGGNNLPGLPSASGTVGAGIPDGVPASPFGPLWTHSLDSRIQPQPRGARISRMAGGGGLSFRAMANGSSTLSPADRPDQLLFLGGTGGVYWLHRDPRSLRSSYYAQSGVLAHAVNADGTDRQWLRYSDSSTPRALAAGPDRLLAIQDAFGRELRVVYQRDQANNASELISELVSDGGERTSFEYDALGRLTTVRWPDGSNQRLVYDPTLPWALVRRIDEAGIAVGNWTWDASSGLVTSTAGADGSNRHLLRFSQPPLVAVTDTLDGSVLRRRYRWQPGTGAEVTRPNGSTVALSGTAVQGDLQLVQRSQPAGAGCAASTSTAVLDNQGNAVVKDDFAGGRSCHAYDTTRQLERVRVEGLDRSAACDTVLADGAPLPAGARKITTRWHPVWPLEEAIAMPGRTVFMAYHGRPDPLASGAIAACLQGPGNVNAPIDAEPAALCRRTQRATSDGDGRLGFQAMADPATPQRDERWTHNRQGQLLSHDGPRSDVADITTHTYHASASTDASAGDLQSVTDPAGHVTWFTRYNRVGQLLERRDTNGVPAAFVYDSRQRLVLSTQAGRSTRFAYASTGMLTNVTLPDSSALDYRYDSAHRLVSISDSSGNRISYTLDNEGQRIREERQDAQGTLTRRLTRVFDALGRVQEQVGRP